MNKTKTKNYVLVENARDKISKAILTELELGKNITKQGLFKVGLKSLALTPEQLKERASGSTYTRYKALTGTIIAEFEKKGAVCFDQAEKGAQSAAALDTSQKKEKVKEYLIATYVTDEERKDVGPNSKLTKIKSLLNNKDKREIFESCPLEKVQSVIEKELKKQLRIEDKVDTFPTTPIGNCLRDNKEKYGALLKNKITKEAYEKSLKDSIIDAINIIGGFAFSVLSLELIKAIYTAVPGNQITGDKISDGPHDRGIDAWLVVTSELGFREKIAIQAKTTQSKTKEIGEKITREFVGSMLMANADKGVIISSTQIHKNAKSIVKNYSNKLIFIDKTLLCRLMIKYKVYLVEEGGALILDRAKFITED